MAAQASRASLSNAEISGILRLPGGEPPLHTGQGSPGSAQSSWGPAVIGMFFTDPACVLTASTDVDVTCLRHSVLTACSRRHPAAMNTAGGIDSRCSGRRGEKSERDGRGAVAFDTRRRCAIQDTAHPPTLAIVSLWPTRIAQVDKGEKGPTAQCGPRGIRGVSGAIGRHGDIGKPGPRGLKGLSGAHHQARRVGDGGDALRRRVSPADHTSETDRPDRTPTASQSRESG